MSYSYLSEESGGGGITKFADLPESMRKKHYKFYKDEQQVDKETIYHPESHLQYDSHIVILLDNPDMRLFVMTEDNSIYNIFGRRQGDDVGFPPFIFTCSSVLNLNSTLQTLFVNNDLIKNKCVDSYIYNFNNLSNKGKLCYEFFEEIMDDKYLISFQKNTPPLSFFII